MTYWTIETNKGYPVTFYAVSPLTACIVTLIAGKGEWSLKGDSTSKHPMPVFESESDRNLFFRTKFSKTFEDCIEDVQPNLVANALASALPLNIKDRRELNLEQLKEVLTDKQFRYLIHGIIGFETQTDIESMSEVIECGDDMLHGTLSLNEVIFRRSLSPA